MLLILVLERKRKAGICEFEPSMVYTPNPGQPGYAVRPYLKRAIHISKTIYCIAQLSLSASF